MAYVPVNGLQLYYEPHGTGNPLVLLHGGLMTIGLNFGPLLEPLAESRQVVGVELQGHGHTAHTGRPMTIQALAGDVVALLDHLGIAGADLFGFSLGGLVSYALALGRPPGGQADRRLGGCPPPAGPGERAPRRGPHADAGRLPGDARRVPGGRARPRALRGVRGQDPAMVHEFPGWTDELRSLQTPTLLIFGDRDFSPLPDVVELFGLLPNAQLAVLPGTTHVGVTRRPGEVLAMITPFLDAC